jgi:hypothetical protein
MLGFLCYRYPTVEQVFQPGFIVTPNLRRLDSLSSTSLSSFLSVQIRRLLPTYEISRLLIYLFKSAESNCYQQLAPSE